MGNTIKGLRCNCGQQQNVSVPEAVVDVFCPNCGALVRLGEALGLTFGQALFGALVVLLLLG
ncbi:MAG TPA: hypothetical protein VHE60_11370 [Pyrinomonadaceae bacterium]|nr:hypothetical protein [Pyrinomonadaceae bacterium]